MSTSLSQLPTYLPVPVDDGAAVHLPGSVLPNIALPSTDGATVNLGDLRGRWVLYIYPMTGRPDVSLPDGWDAIPGAGGCTPQSCGFRDHYAELKALNTGLFGLSAQTTQYQREARDRLHLPFQLLTNSTPTTQEHHAVTDVHGGRDGAIQAVDPNRARWTDREDFLSRFPARPER